MRMVVNEKRHYKMYKKGRLWVIAGITVATVGAGKLTARAAASAPVDSAAQAGQTDSVSVVQPKQVTLTTPKVVAENESVNNDPSAPAGSASAPSESTATEPSSAPASPTSAVTPTSSAAPSAADSGAPTQPQSVGSAGATNAPETDQSAAPTSVAPASKLVTAASKVASAQPVTTKASARAVEADTGDEDVSGQFEDANLLAAVRKGLKLADDQVLTVNVIKEHTGNESAPVPVSTKTDTGYNPVTSLKGLELLGNLNDRTRVSVDLELGSTAEQLQAIDLSPLKALRLGGLYLFTDFWRSATDEQLKLIAGLDASQVDNATFSRADNSTPTVTGLDNRQFAMLVPFIKGVFENYRPLTHNVTITGNNITDFSSMKVISPQSHSVALAAGLQYYVIPEPIYYSEDQTYIVTTPLTDINGESIKFNVGYYQDDGSGNYIYKKADAFQEEETAADGTTKMVWKYKLVSPVALGNMLRYGQWYVADATTLEYTTDAMGNPMKSFTINTAVHVVQNVTDSQASLTFNPSEVVMGPKASWNYLDHINTVTDYDGNPIDASQWANLAILQAPTLDLTTAGQQTVLFQYTDNQKRVVYGTAVVNVVAGQAAITAVDDQIVWPSEVGGLTPADLVASLTDATGQALTDFSTVTMTALDPTKVGIQPVTLSYTDVAGNVVTAIANVTVDLATLSTTPTEAVAGPTASWDYQTALTTATDSNGQSVDVQTVTVKVVTPPDLSTAKIGQPQTVVLAYTDDLGRTQQVEATVTTVKTKAAITTVGDQIIWPSEVSGLTVVDLVTGVTDATGQALTDFSTVTMTAVDASKAGNQPVTLSYTDAAGNVVTAVVNVMVDLATLTTTPTEVIAGPTASWDYLSALTAAIDSNGQPIDVTSADVQVVTLPDLTDAKLGEPQAVELIYTDNLGRTQRFQTTVTTIKTKAGITAKADQIVWPSEVSGLTLADLVASVTDATGQALTDFSTVTMTALDPTKAGVQPVTLSYTDVAGNVVTAVANVTVDLATLSTTPTEVVAGPSASWDYRTALTSATNGNGQPIDVQAANVQVVNSPDLSTAKIGVPQTVVLSYTDDLGKTQQVETTVTTLKTKAALAGINLTLVAGPNTTWQLADSVDLTNSFDVTGQPLTTANLTEIKADQVPDVQTPGSTLITLSYVDAVGNQITGTSTVTVVASQAAITPQADQVVWPREVAGLTVADLVAGVTDATGQAVADLSQVTMTMVDPAKAGAQAVTLRYVDAVGNVVTATAYVTVDLASLTTTATEVVAGPNASWDYLTAITVATDSNGQAIDGHNADVQVVTPPDLSTAKIGVPQTVALAYTDNLGRTQTVNATVTTLKSQAILAGTDLTLIAGPNATWQLSDSVDLAHSLDASGQPLTTADLTKITADTRPDVQTPGDYPVTLRYVDAAGNLIIGNASVTVVASKAAIKVTDSQLTTGATWQPADNFVSATAADGQPLVLTDLTVTGSVATSRPGTYQVSYQYTDASGNVVTATATVTVADPETPIEPEEPENPEEPKEPEEPQEPEQPGEGDGIQDGNNQQNEIGTGQETTADGDQVDGPNSTTSQGKQSVNAESLTPEAPVTVQPASAKVQANAAALPQTDETPRNALAVLAGALGLSSLVAGVGATRRRRDR